MPLRPLGTSPLDGLFALLALMALSLLVTALLQTPGFMALEAWYYALHEKGYMTYIHITELRGGVTKVDDFRAHMIVQGAQALPLLALMWWYVRVWLPRRSEPDAPHHRTTAALLGLGCGGAMATFAAGCFLSLPGTVAACAAFAKEGVIDTLHSVGFLVAAGMFAVAAVRNAKASPGRPGRLIGGLLGLAAFGAFVIGMEEISWGQTWLGWESPDLFVEINDQKETNLHNIFNGWLQIAYYGVGFGTLAGTVGLLVLRDVMKSHPVAQAVLPPRALLFAAIWFPLGSEVFVYASTEVFETLMTLYALAYAFGVYTRTSNPAGEDLLDMGLRQTG